MATTLSHSLSVFLADDVADDRVLFEEAVLELSNKVKITTSTNGELLMNRLEDKKSLKPNLIFLDFNMPLKNGIQCMEEIKTDSILKYIPGVIF